MKISVIVPIYNVEKYLNKCIESIINQTLKDIEIILINDGSTDNSLDIIKKYEKLDSRIIVINKKNGGQSSARNEGLKIAKGEYIGFVDSDDWIDLDMYEKLYINIKNTNSDIAIGGRRIISENGKCEFERNLKNEKFEIDNIEDYILDNLLIYQTVSCCNKIYKNEIIKKNNIKFENVNLVGSEDTLFNCCIIMNIRNSVTVEGTYYNGLERLGSTTRVYKSGCITRTSNLLEKINSYANLYNKEDIRDNLLIIFLVFFQQWNYNFIKSFGQDSLVKILSEEHKLANENETFRKVQKKLVVNKNTNYYMKKMGYSSRGIKFFKIYNWLSYKNLNSLAAKLRSIV